MPDIYFIMPWGVVVFLCFCILDLGCGECYCSCLYLCVFLSICLPLLCSLCMPVCYIQVGLVFCWLSVLCSDVVSVLYFKYYVM